MSATLLRLLQGAWRALLSFVDEVRPGWSEQVEPRHNAFGGPLSAESLNYWLCAERARRIRD